MQELL